MPLTVPHATPHSRHHGRNPDEQDSTYREFRELPALFRDELKVIRRENMLLYESQQVIHRDYKRLHEVKEDMRKLVETVCSTKEAQPAAVSHATTQPIPQLPSLGAWPVSTPSPVYLPPPVEENDGVEWPETPHS
ncbi:hypothetical protein AAFF_G00066800 [Aldrovandia affinis]|uniref:Uncharacterized protein n=1 Tax=Aldrovandia affinis TaxID=143900 RepID=A0AAD7T5A6_9TELE|nr:hypothetical protein AAFF_G00066800 [Aldrovandia affinis]